MQGHYRSIATWLMGGLLVVSIMALARPGAGATNSVTDVHYGTVDGAFKLTVVTSGAVTTQVHRYSVDSASDVQDLVIDVTPAAYDGRTKVIAFSDGPIHQVRVGQLSPAVMRIVVESKGSAKYDLNQKDGEKSVTLALTTSQQPHTLDPAAAAAAARAAGARQTQALSADMSTTPAQHTSLVPAPAVVAAAKPVAVEAPVKPVVHSAPEVVAKATPNPWLPGGKYYCKVPGMPGYHGGHSTSSASVAPSMSGPSYPSSPSRSTSTAVAPPGTVSIDIKNGDLLDVIKLLAQESGQNIVATASRQRHDHDQPAQRAAARGARSDRAHQRSRIPPGRQHLRRRHAGRACQAIRVLGPGGANGRLPDHATPTRLIWRSSSARCCRSARSPSTPAPIRCS